MASAGTVTIDFAAETAKFTAELQKVNSRLKNLEGGFQSIARVAKVALGALSVGAITSFVRSAANAADELGKTADKLGVSAESFRTLQIAAVGAGVGLEAANKLLVESQKRLGEAAAGSGEAARVIALLGLNVQELQRLSPDQLFLTYSRAIGELSTRSEQLAAANTLMGKSAQEAFNLIRDGGAAVESASALVERYGLVLSRVDIRQIEQANDRLGELQLISQSAGQQIAAGLSPAVEFLATTLLGAIGNTEELKKRAEQFSAGAIVAFEIVANAARTLQAAFFGLAAGGARVLQALTFGDVSESFAASVDVNLAKANEALAKVQSIEKIQETVVRALEESRRSAEESVAAQAAQPIGGSLSLAGESIGLTQQQRFDIVSEAAEVAADRQIELQREISRATDEELESRARSASSWREFERSQNENAARSEISLRQEATNLAISGIALLAGRSKTWAKIQKGIQIAQAIRDTYVGITHQLTSGDPFTAVARALAVGAFGFAQVASIVSTPDFGGGSFGGVSASSGVPSGGAVNPVFSDQSSGRQQQETVPVQQPVTQIVFAGPVFNSQATRDFIIEAIKEEIDRDVIVISPTSRNGQELAGVPA